MSEPLSPLFAPIGLFIFFKSLKFKSLKKDVIAIFLFSLAIGFFGFYWIPQTMKTFGGLDIRICYLLYLLFIPFLLPHAWIGYFFVRKFQLYKSVFSTAAILCVAEVISPTQFPVYAGQGWMQWSFALGLAPLFGVCAYSFLNYYLSLSLLKKQKSGLITSALIICIAIISSSFTIQEKALGTNKQDLKVRFVQANIGNFLKIQSELGQFSSLSQVYNTYERLSIYPKKDIDLIIWPETAYPDDLNSKNLQSLTQSKSYLQNILDSTQSELLLGGYDYGQLEKSKNNFKTVYNATFQFSPLQTGLKNFYHKQSLIPFGETLPFGPFNKSLQKYAQGVSFFSKGSFKTVFHTSKDQKFITPICYEILNTSLVRDLLNTEKSIDFIINLTNDSWYGMTAEPYQHLYLSKWRAVEFQKPILRSTNSGITSVIDVDGTESKRLLLGEVANLDIALSMPERKDTIFQTFGHWAFLLFLLFVFIIERGCKKYV